MIDGVTVRWANADDGGGWRWRLCWQLEDGFHATYSPGFVRKRDAEMGLRALAQAGVTLEDFRAMPLGDERWEHDHILFGALQW